MKAIELINQENVVVVAPVPLLRIPPLGWGMVEKLVLWGAHTFPYGPFIITKLIQDPLAKNLLLLSYFNGSQEIKDIRIPTDFPLNPIKAIPFKKQILAHYDKYQSDKFVVTLSQNGVVGQLGSDPEIFVESEGELLPAFAFLKSKLDAGVDKTDHFTRGEQHFGGPPTGHKVYWDGFQAEFETYASSCLADQVDCIYNGMRKVLQCAKKVKIDAKLSSKTVFDIPKKLLEESEDQHVGFGCMPSKNVYGMTGEQVPPRELPFRSAGGHIHFGLYQKDEVFVTKAVKALDAILGVACVAMFQKFDDPRRRKFYGMAGEYRTPPHGLEYRVLSNAWMIHPLITNMVFDVARKVVIAAHKNVENLWVASQQEVIECINNCDVKLAQEILKRNKNVMLMILRSCYSLYSDDDAELLYNVFYNGLHTVVKDPNNLEKNWNLDGQAVWQNHGEGHEKNVCHALPSLRKNDLVA